MIWFLIWLSNDMYLLLVYVEWFKLLSFHPIFGVIGSFKVYLYHHVLHLVLPNEVDLHITTWAMKSSQQVAPFLVLFKSAIVKLKCFDKSTVVRICKLKWVETKHLSTSNCDHLFCEVMNWELHLYLFALWYSSFFFIKDQSRDYFAAIRPAFSMYHGQEW